LLAGVLAASVLTVMLVLLGWAKVETFSQINAGFWPFITSFLIALTSCLGVGIFEEILLMDIFSVDLRSENCLDNLRYIGQG